MGKRDKSRIQTDGGSSLGSNPFGGLGGLDLPAGSPAEPQSGPAKKAAKPSGPGRGQRIEVRRLKAGKGGKTVTEAKGFTGIHPEGLDDLARELRKACATGGTRKGQSIELQGDVRDRLIAELERRGFKPVRAGG